MALLCARPGLADPLPDLRDLALCVGRLSAMVEHQWAVDGPASDATRDLRDAMAEVLAAAAPPGDAPVLMAWRIEAKLAQAALLQAAVTGPRPEQARRRAAQLVGPCIALVS